LPATCLNDIDIIILAGGFGTRLRSVFSDRPKVLVPINGVPFLRCYLDWLRRFGARRVILALGYKAEMVQDYIKSEKWSGRAVAAVVEACVL
jgi:D-glycero-alpha-D-manno-heptose 1-phosphate guanylyltransferase